MKAIRIVSYFIYTAILVLVICLIFNITIVYITRIFAFLLFISSILFIVEAYHLKKERTNSGLTKVSDNLSDF
jgi:uncharacterized membrane protein HdeD (DUF308 family)